MTALTDNAARLIAHILLSQYNDGGAANEVATYAWDACDGFDSKQQGAGTLARAADAGLVWHEAEGEDSTVGITDQGWAAFTAMFGKCDAADFDAYTDLAQRVLHSLNCENLSIVVEIEVDAPAATEAPDYFRMSGKALRAADTEGARAEIARRAAKRAAKRAS
jgi:uncharacterized lipoprotein NlpE involved in copper resistance